MGKDFVPISEHVGHVRDQNGVLHLVKFSMGKIEVDPKTGRRFNRFKTTLLDEGSKMRECPDFDSERAWVDDAKKASAKWNRSQAVGAFIAEYSERHRFEDRYYRMMERNTELGMKIRSLNKRIRQLERGGRR